MKRSKIIPSYLSFLLVLLWLVASNREFYLHYTIETLKKQQEKTIAALKESNLTKKIVVPPSCKEILVIGDDELYYQDTLYDIVQITEKDNGSFEYILLSDFREQSLWHLLIENSFNHHTKKLAVDFNFKFVAINRPLESFSSYISLLKLRIPLLSVILYSFDFTSQLLQPPEYPMNY